MFSQTWKAKSTVFTMFLHLASKTTVFIYSVFAHHHHPKNTSRRKFRSQTSDNMDRWQSRDGESQRRESEKEEDQRRERVRRKKMQVASSTSKGCRPCRQPRKKRHVAGVKSWHCLPHLILQPASPQSTGWAVCLCDASETATHHQFVVVVVVGGGGGVLVVAQTETCYQ